MRQIVPIVEGHGELHALPVLIHRILETTGAAASVQVLKPVREHRGTLLRPGGIERLAQARRRKAKGDARILVVLDADDDCSATVGPQLQHRLEQELGAQGGTVVLAVREYENWLISDAAAISRDNAFRDSIREQSNPEAVRDAKRWLSDRTKTRRYSYDPTIDQARLSGLVDISVVRQRCPSFDKFWREVEHLTAL